MNRWYVTPKAKPFSSLKLLCFPYAGGGVASFSSWPRYIADDVEVNIIQLPGRGALFDKEPIDNMDELIAQLMPNIEHLLQADYVIFGHSLGSRVGFEVAKRAIELGLKAPLHFFASGSAGPESRCFEEKIYEYPDADFIQELHRMNGTPQEVLDSRELMAMFLPMLRADFKMAGEYFYDGEITLPCPVSVLFGKDDCISESQIKMWGNYFLSYAAYPCDGGHFFIDTHSDQVLERLNQYFTNRALINIA